MASGWKPGHAPEDVDASLGRVLFKFESRAIRTSEGITERMEQWMKDNAIWQDRTGDARRGLYSKANRTGERGQGRSIVIEFGYGPEDDPIDYAFYLATMQAGRFDILAPAAAYWGSRILEEVYGQRLED